jgi:hypothetical protein
MKLDNTLREAHRLMLLENKVLRITSGPKREVKEDGENCVRSFFIVLFTKY